MMDCYDSLPPIATSRLQDGTDIQALTMLDEALDLGIAILDSDLRYQYLGKGLFRQLGLPEGSLQVGDTLQDCHNLMIKHGILTPELLETRHLTAAEQRDLGQQKFQSQLMKLNNGTTAQLTRKTLPSGHIVSMSFDATKLVEKDELLEEALRLGQAGYWVYDFATKSYKMSGTLRAYFSGESLEQINKQGILAIVHPDDREKFRNALRNIGRTNDIFQHTCRTNSFTGNERYSRTTARLVRGADGKPVALRAFVKDITRDRRHAAELERAKDDAIAASHAKSEFLANMSHEIRTPMNGVLGMAELLANSNVDEQQKEFIRIINTSATALLNIINDILDFSKIEAGRLELDPIAFNLSETINDVVAMLIPKAQEKNLELVINYPPSLPRGFIADAGRIRQVVTNLIGNAIKFTDSGHVIIDVGVAERNTGKAVLKLSVTDTGIGIEADKLAAVFQKFTQADGSTTRTYGGTGLGLSISKKIIELMGGRMQVTSTFGKGSSFSFDVPLELDATFAKTHYDTAVMAGKRVLIVDDIEINRRLMIQQAQGWDMTPTAVRDGVEALVALRDAAAQSTPYDLILVDYFMPGMNGKELAAIIGATDSLARPPVIMLSSSDENISSQELANIGVRSYLVKPVAERHLFKTIVKVLSTQAEGFPQMPTLSTSAVTGLETIRDGITDTAANMRATIPTPPAPSVSMPKIEVLVAEDFALNRDVVRLMLADTTFAPIFAENGKEAVDMFAASPDRFALVVMDVSMPVMDGYDATALINQFNDDNGRPHTPIIALTGHALKHDRDKCIEAGMDDYLTKPVQQTRLIEMLEHFYSKVAKGAYAVKVA